MNVTKKVLWIEVKETVSRNVGLTIGEHISQEEADGLITMMQNEEVDSFAADTSEYGILDSYLGEDYCDTEGFDNVQVYIKDEKI